MNVHQNLLTTDISTTNTWYVGISAGHTIETNGYYDEDDGGGATFIVRAKESGEQADGLFVLDVYGTSNPSLVAVLDLPNGIVKADWLGFIPTSSDPELENVNTANFTDWYNDFTDNVSYQNNDGADILAEAVANDNVREIQFTSGKCYPLSETVFIENDNKVFNGNGALLIADRHYDEPMFSVEQGVSNITFCNLRLSSIRAINDIPCIAAEDAENIRLDNVTFLMSGRGFVADGCDGLHLQNIRASNCVKLLSVVSSSDVTAENISFSNPFRGNAGTLTNLTDAVLFVGAGCDHVALRDIRIVDTICKTAVAVVGTQANSVTNCSIMGLYAESLGKLLPNAIGSPNGNVLYLKYVRWVSLLHVYASQINTAVTMENVQNCKFANCIFESRLDSVQPIITLGNGVCSDVWFVRCFLISDQWFHVQNRTVTDDDLQFAFCVFRARDLSGCAVPAAYFGNSISGMCFTDCRFDGRGLSDTTPSLACLFTFCSDTNTESRFSFTRCALESPDENVNSPVRVSLNGGEDVCVEMRECTLYGFRWTTRLTANENESTVGTIDPAASGFVSDTDAQTTAALLTSLGRFLSQDNIYLYHTLPQGQTEYCRRAETYGVTE